MATYEDIQGHCLHEWDNEKRAEVDEHLDFIDDIDLDHQSYDFDQLRLYVRRSDGMLLWATDSGCSCPMPFETTPVRDLRESTSATFIDTVMRDEVEPVSYRSKSVAEIRKDLNAALAEAKRRVMERFWAKVDQSGDCWIWNGSRTTKGYGTFWAERATWYAHRFAYEALIGPIPDGLVIDHLCRNPACVNASHLEAVTTAENTRRGLMGFELTGQCRAGHDVTAEGAVLVDQRGNRRCARCSEASDSRYNAKQSAERAAASGRTWPRTHCPQGHAYNAENTYITPRGHRRCITCRNSMRRKGAAA